MNNKNSKTQISCVRTVALTSPGTDSRDILWVACFWFACHLMFFLSTVHAQGIGPCAEDVSKDTVGPLALSALSASTLSAGRDVDFIISEDINFPLNMEALSSGKAQAYTILEKKRDLKRDKKFQELLKQVDAQKVYAAEGELFSFLKLAYVIPAAKVSDFTQELLTDVEYIEGTNDNLKRLAPKLNPRNLRTRKKIPVFDAVDSEFALSDFVAAAPGVVESSTIASEKLEILKGLNAELGPVARIGVSQLLETTEPILIDSQSVNMYYQLADGSGILVVTYTAATLDYSAAGFAKAIIIKAIPDYVRVSNFKGETGSMIKKNRKYFSAGKK